MIKVCQISTVHSKNDDRIFFKECVSLYEGGYDVSFVVASENSEVVNGVKIIALKKSTSRFYRVFILSWVAFFKALTVKARIYHFHDPELMLIGVFLKLVGKKVIYDVHEDLPKQVLYKLWIKPALLRKLLSGFIYVCEQFCCLFFDVIIPATPDIAKKFKPEKVCIIRNVAIMNMIDKTPVYSDGMNTFKLIYVGGLSEIRGIKEVIRALEIINDPTIVFWLLGQWSSDAYRLECEKMEGYKHVKYFGLVNLTDVYPYIKGADVGISILYPAKNYITSLPIKAFEYMACKKPMIMSDFEYWKTTFEGAAVFTNPLDSEDIARKILNLKSEKQLCESLGEYGKKMVTEKFSWEEESKQLLKQYEKLIKQNS